MSGSSNLIALSDDVEQSASFREADTIATTEPLLLDEAWEDEPSRPAFNNNRLIPLLFAVSIAVWTGVFLWAHSAGIRAGISLTTGLTLISQWAPTVALIAVAWLLVMRTSRREMGRFTDAARELDRESQRLEARLESVNRELSLAREFIAAQSRDIEALGRTAVERISGHADRLAGLVADNSAQVDTIGSVSEAALDNMEKLRGQLPVIASSAKDVTNQIGNAGRTAHIQLQELITGFSRLNEFGQASERQVFMLRKQIDETLVEMSGRFAGIDTNVGAQLENLRETSGTVWDQLEAREAAASSAIRERAGALGAEIEATRSHLDQAEAEVLASLRARLGAVRDEGTAIGRSLSTAQDSALAAWEQASARLESGLQEAIGRISELDAMALASARQRLEDLVEESERVDQRLGEHDQAFAAKVANRQDAAEQRQSALVAQLTGHLENLDAIVVAQRQAQEMHTQAILAEGATAAATVEQMNAQLSQISARGSEAVAQLGTSRSALAEIETAQAVLTDGTVRMLELIQASVEHSQTGLPKAIAASDRQLSNIEARVGAFSAQVEQMASNGAELAQRLDANREVLAQIHDMHGTLEQRGAAHADHLETLAGSLAAVDTASRAMAEQALGDLTLALGRLQEATRDAASNLATTSEMAIDALAARVGERSGSAIDAAVQARADQVGGMLEAAASKAAALSTEAAVQLRDQLARLDELTGNLERRVTHARERAEEQVDHDFARRVALITESLNSNAIDIARALDAEVSDTAWASYLRGDRGVFTRRAVKLLEPGEAKAIAAIYRNDSDFRDHVSRYIHDFEAMLRQLLSTRDGHALGVTLLSSDMGKLYVAMAQAIERLRN